MNCVNEIQENARCLPLNVGGYGTPRKWRQVRQ